MDPRQPTPGPESSDAAVVALLVVLLVLALAVIGAREALRIVF